MIVSFIVCYFPSQQFQFRVSLLLYHGLVVREFGGRRGEDSQLSSAKHCIVDGSIFHPLKLGEHLE